MSFVKIFPSHFLGFLRRFNPQYSLLVRNATQGVKSFSKMFLATFCCFVKIVCSLKALLYGIGSSMQHYKPVVYNLFHAATHFAS